MTYQNVFLIFNPCAGALNGHRIRLLQRTIDVLAAAGHKITARPTAGAGLGAQTARECLQANADLILVAGGDGTINEVLNGMVGSRVPLAILPAGTANVLAVELNLGLRTDRAARVLSDAVPERISVGLLRTGSGVDRHFLLMAGIGLDACIVETVNPALKRRIGKLSYWIGGFSMVGRRLDPFQVRIDGKTVNTSFALVSRVRTYGGDLQIARGASLLDHEFELVLFEGENTVRYLGYFAGVLTRRLNRMRGVTITRARKVELITSAETRIPVQVDGECAGTLPATIEIVPDAVTLLVPPSFRSAETGRPAAYALRG